jgi:hypothetical protein
MSAILESFDEFFHERLNLIADWSHGINALARRIVEFPIQISLSWKERASIAAAHCDNYI